MLLVVSTRHSYEITPQPTAMNVVPESQRDIHSLLELSQIVHRQWEEKKRKKKKKTFTGRVTFGSVY